MKKKAVSLILVLCICVIISPYVMFNANAITECSQNEEQDFCDFDFSNESLYEIFANSNQESIAVSSDEYKHFFAGSIPTDEELAFYLRYQLVSSIVTEEHFDSVSIDGIEFDIVGNELIWCDNP